MGVRKIDITKIRLELKEANRLYDSGEIKGIELKRILAEIYLEYKSIKVVDPIESKEILNYFTPLYDLQFN